MLILSISVSIWPSQRPHAVSTNGCPPGHWGRTRMPTASPHLLPGPAQSRAQSAAHQLITGTSFSQSREPKFKEMHQPKRKSDGLEAWFFNTSLAQDPLCYIHPLLPELHSTIACPAALLQKGTSLAPSAVSQPSPSSSPAVEVTHHRTNTHGIFCQTYPP